MKTVCLQENLAQALAITQRVAPRNPILPILSHVVLTADDDHLRLSATNLEFGVNVWIGGRIEETGAIAVPADTITDLVKTYPPDGTVRMRVTPKGTLQITCGRHRSNIKGTSADEGLFVAPEKGGENEAAEPFEAVVPAPAMRFLSTLCHKQEGQVTAFLWKPPSADETLSSPTRIIFRIRGEGIHLIMPVV